MNTSFNLDVDCDVGYYGKKCNLPCRHPSYGSLCQKRCDCSDMKCDHVYGCGNGINFKHICKKKSKIKIYPPPQRKIIDAFKTEI